MIDDDVLSESEQDQLALLAWVYLQELACPHSVLFKLRPTVALGKVCRDCKLNPTRAACTRQRRVRRARRAPASVAVTAPAERAMTAAAAGQTRQDRSAQN